MAAPLSESEAKSSPSGRLVSIAQVRAGAETEFAAQLNKINADLLTVEGFVSLESIPSQPQQPEWINVIQFESADLMEKWLASELHGKWMEKFHPLVEGRLILLRGKASQSIAVPDSVTEVIVTHLVPGQEAAYRAWAGRIQQTFVRFPGFQGVNSRRQQNGEAWTTLIRFDTVENLDFWLNSPERRALLEETKPFIADVHLHRVEPSFPGWVGVDAAGQPPPRWKTTLLVLLSLYPIANFDLFVVFPLLPKLPWGISYFLPYCVGVILISYLAMPFFVRAFSPWLYAGRMANRKKDLAGVAVILVLLAIEIVAVYAIFHGGFSQ